MQPDNLAICRLLAELKPLLEGAYVNNASEIGKGVLKLKLHTKQGSKDLIITQWSAFITKYSIAASPKKTNFTAALKKELYNRRIMSIEQHGLDRVLEMKFSDKELVLEFIGDGNKILAARGETIACERNEDWADRKTRRGFPYSFPKAKGINPAKITPEELGRAFSASKKDAVRELLSCANVSPQIAEEALHRAGIQKSAPANSVPESGLSALADALAKIFSEASEANGKAFLYNNFSPAFASPVILHGVNAEPASFDSMGFLLCEEFAKEFSSLPRAEETAKGQKPKKDLAGSLEMMRSKQQESIKKFESLALESTKKAELIYSHYAEIEELRKAVLAGIQSGAGEKQITERLSGAVSRGNKAAKLLRKVDMKKREIEVELE
ncbi:Uncharacterised protein [uncultured archaeon]|nr:Uncharacterised protein [uncultured archaeon]